jgi:carbon storage regulator
MLILTRRPGESIVIGENIRVTILGVRESQAKVGVEAPKEITVHRDEVFKRIEAAKDIIDIAVAAYDYQ